MSGIDGIGKRGAPPPPVAPREAAEGTSKVAEVSTSFREVAASKGVEGAGRVSASPALDQLRAGNVDVNGYLDLKVNEATAGLSGLPSAELDSIKRVLREQLSGDPGLSDLVQKATGAKPLGLPGDDE